MQNKVLLLEKIYRSIITSVLYIFKSVYNIKINKNYNRITRKYKVIARKKLEKVLFIHTLNTF